MGETVGEQPTVASGLVVRGLDDAHDPRESRNQAKHGVLDEETEVKHH